MIEVDLEFLLTILSIIVIVCGAIGIIWKMMHKMVKHYEPLPEKVARLEEDNRMLMRQMERCPFREADMTKFQESLEELSKRSENDFRMIHQQSRTLDIMLEALTAMMDHMVTGNHQEKMEEVKTEMIRQMGVSRKDLMYYD